MSRNSNFNDFRFFFFNSLAFSSYRPIYSVMVFLRRCTHLYAFAGSISFGVDSAFGTDERKCAHVCTPSRVNKRLFYAAPRTRGWCLRALNVRYVFIEPPTCALRRSLSSRRRSRRRYDDTTPPMPRVVSPPSPPAFSRANGNSFYEQIKGRARRGSLIFFLIVPQIGISHDG